SKPAAEQLAVTEPFAQPAEPDAEDVGVEAQTPRRLGGAAPLQPQLDQPPVALVEALAQPGQQVGVLDRLGGGGLVASERGQQAGLGLGGLDLFGPLLPFEPPPVTRDLPPDQGDRQAQQLLRAADDEAILAQPEQQRLVDGLDEIDRIEVASHRAAEQHA